MRQPIRGHWSAKLFWIFDLRPPTVYIITYTTQYSSGDED